MSVHFKIMVPVYNSEQWIGNTLLSVLNQDYYNYECIVVDDCSTDNTLGIIENFIRENDCRDSFSVNQNPQRMGICYNHYNMIQTMDADDDDVLITLDGDDWFYGNSSLSKLNEIYQDKDVWLTYGSYITVPEGNEYICRSHVYEYSEEDKINGAFKDDPVWKASHLRSFKYFLAKRIEKEDLLDEDGSFYEMAGDLALMYPMMEMARERVRFVPDLLYVYNMENPLNEHKIDVEKQLSADRKIRKLPIKERLIL